MSRWAADVLESWILDAVGALPPDRARRAEALTRRFFPSSEPDWRDRVREEFGLAPESRAQITALWRRAQAFARERAEDLDPESFAAMVVEESFADVVGMVDALPTEPSD